MAASTPGELREIGSVTPVEQELTDATTSGRAPRAPAVAGRALLVVDAGGRPVPGATVRITAVDAAWFRPWLGSRSVTVEELDARSRSTRTLQDGSFVPEEPTVPDLDQLVLWVLHPDHLARGFTLTRDELDALEGPIRLEPAPPIHALVVGPGSEPVAEARVHQRIRDPHEDPRRDADPEVRARRVLELVHTTDRDGRARLFPLPELQGVFAEQGELASGYWLGQQPAEVRLELLPTFVAAGRVDPWPPPAPGVARVLCIARTAELSRVLHAKRVEPDGRFGPVRMPLVDADRFVFRLEAPGSLPFEGEVERPAPGARVDVRLRLENGEPLLVSVRDQEGDALAGAAVQTYWNVGGEWCYANAHAGEDGYASFAACPPGSLWIRASCKGFVGRLLDPLEHRPEAPPVEIVLQRAGRLQVRCISRGEPVSDFTLLHWGPSGQIDVEDAIGAEEGMLVLDEVPVGPVTLVAFSAASGQSEPVVATVSAEDAAQVEIELPPGRVGVGLVVDASTGEPIEGARIGVSAIARGTRVTTRGVERRTAADGRFEVVGLGSGRNSLFVVAEGYESSSPSATADEEARIDFGVVSLQRRQPFELVLVPEFEGLPFEECRVELRGTEYHARRPFDSSGVARFEGIGPGPYGLSLFLPSGILVHERIELVAGREWRFELPLSARIAFTVEVVSSEGPLPDDLHLLSTWRRTDERVVVEKRWIPADGMLVIETMACEGVTLAVEREDQWLAFAVLGAGDLAGGHVRMEIRPPRELLRVVDREKQPIASVAVSLRAPGDLSGWSFGTRTDASGECLLPEPPGELWLVDLIHPTRGHAIQVPLRLRGSLTEIELDARASVHLLLVDGTRPIGGVQIALAGLAPGSLGFTNVYSDAAGQARVHGLALGEYVARVRFAGYWPHEQVVEARESPPLHTLALLRLGSLELELSRGGASLPGVRIELASDELEELVGTWVARGLARASSAQLLTDAAGRLRIDGIPRGRYAWQVDLGSAGVHSGEVEVPAGGLGSARILLP